MSKNPLSIADKVKLAGRPGNNPVVIGKSALDQLAAHQKKMKQPVSATVQSLLGHLKNTGAVNFDEGIAKLEKEALSGNLP